MKNNKENTVKLYGSEIITNFHPENKLYISTNMWMVHPYIHSFIYTYIHVYKRQVHVKHLLNYKLIITSNFFFTNMQSCDSEYTLCACVRVSVCVCMLLLLPWFLWVFSLLFKILNDKWLGYLSHSTKLPFLHYFYT